MFYTAGVSFDDLSIVLSVYKKQNRPLEEVLSFFSRESNRESVKELYPNSSPITIREAIQLPNAEQRMAILRLFAPEEIAEELQAKLLDSQTIRKTQIRWDKSLKPYKHTFEDTYSLYQIKAGELGIEERPWWKSPNVYFVKCKCATTDRLYYIYVPQDAAKNNDAIEAIAWTMQINGKPITKKQYLNLMYSEA
jgi:hypothetical protein